MLKIKYIVDKVENFFKKVIENVKKVVGEIFLEFKLIGIIDICMCWYMDSIDNFFVIDYVLGYLDSLFVVFGGLGYGFKFFFVLGKVCIFLFFDIIFIFVNGLKNWYIL